MSPWRKRLQLTAIALCAIVSIGGGVFHIIWRFQMKSDAFHPRLIAFNPSIKTAFEAKIHESHTIFEYGIVMLGALWGLVILKEKGIDITPSDRPEIIMFLCSNILFVVFLIFHYFYSDTLTEALLYAGKSHDKEPYIPDLSIWEIQRLFWLAIFALVSFLFVGTAALFSAYNLKEVAK
jgi:hypothetical protein